MAIWQRVRSFVWGEIPATRAERLLLLKIDWFILSYCCLMVRVSPSTVVPQVTILDVTSTSQTVRSFKRTSLYAPRLNANHADLDRSNVNNAYVSGMREELHMVGTQFNVDASSTSGFLLLTPALI